MMIQYARFTVEDFRKAYGASYDNPHPRRIFALGEATLKTSSAQYQLFYTRGVECVACGMRGNVFILESSTEGVRSHLNLYYEDGEGNLTLFTKDHIISKSLGGPNALENYQVMCQPCNQAKGNRMEGATLA